MSVYLIFHKPSGKGYVGQTVQPLSARMSGHRYASDSRPTQYISKAIAKHGWKEFSVHCLQTCEKEDLNRFEEAWIDELNTHVSTGMGYNLDWGGKSKPKSEETKARLSAAHKGRIVSDATKAKLSAARTGIKMKPRSAEHRRKIGDAHRGRKHTAEHRAKHSAAIRGRPMSEETKKKISMAATGKKRGPYKATAGANISAAKKGKKIKRTPEHNAKIAAALKGRKKSNTTQ